MWVLSGGKLHKVLTVCVFLTSNMRNGIVTDVCVGVHWAALTTLLSCTSGFMVSCTTNQVAFRRINAVIRFQWMIFLRHRILLRIEEEREMEEEERGEKDRKMEE